MYLWRLQATGYPYGRLQSQAQTCFFSKKKKLLNFILLYIYSIPWQINRGVKTVNTFTMPNLTGPIPLPPLYSLCTCSSLLEILGDKTTFFLEILIIPK